MGTEHDKTFFRNVRQIPKDIFFYIGCNFNINFNKIKTNLENEDEYLINLDICLRMQFPSIVFW